MTPAELRESLFASRHQKPVEESHTLVCLHCGSVEEYPGSTCDEAQAFAFPPELLQAIADLASELEATREAVLRGLLAVGLASIERGGHSAHTRAVVFLRDLEEAEAEGAPDSSSGPLGLVDADTAEGAG